MQRPKSQREPLQGSKYSRGKAPKSAVSCLRGPQAERMSRQKGEKGNWSLCIIGTTSCYGHHHPAQHRRKAARCHSQDSELLPLHSL